VSALYRFRHEIGDIFTSRSVPTLPGVAGSEVRTVADRSHIVAADAPHDVLDDVEVALSAIDVHFAPGFPPFGPCGIRHVSPVS
jgi:hypothetical protein